MNSDDYFMGELFTNYKTKEQLSSQITTQQLISALDTWGKGAKVIAAFGGQVHKYDAWELLRDRIKEFHIPPCQREK